MKKMLIAEDNRLNKSMLVHIFEGEFELLIASDGNETIKYLNEYKKEIDILLLDLVMPNKSGFDVIKEMKENEELKDIPVVIVTAHDDKDVGFELSSLGADEIIYKPFDFQIVKTRVKNVLIAKNYQIKNNYVANKNDSKNGFLGSFPINENEPLIANISCSRIFDKYRIVDPITNNIFLIEENKLVLKGIKCFSSLCKSENCEKCICKLSITNNQPYFKFVKLKDKTYLIAAAPFEYNNYQYAVEFIKDVSTTLCTDLLKN